MNADLHVEKEQLTASRWALTVEVPAEETERQLEAELVKFQREADLPGFRRGKAPLALIRKRFGKTMETDFLRKRLLDYYEQAVKTSGIPEPVAPPEIDILKFNSGEPLVFKATVDVQPPVDLADYEGLTVVREKAVISDSDVDEQIERMRERQAVIHDDPAPAGNESVVEVDLQELDSAYLPVIGRKRDGVIIDLGRSSAEIRDSLRGASAGEVRRVTTQQKTPSPGEKPPEPQHFQVTVKSVKRKELPALDEDFVKSIDPELTDLKALRETVRNYLQHEADMISFQRMSHLLVHQVVDHSRLDVPESMVKNYLDRIVADARQGAEKNGEPFDEMLIRDQYRGRAVWNLKWYLIRKKIAEKEGLTVTEEDIQKELERLSAASGKKLKAVQAMYSDERKREQLTDDLIERKVLNLLMTKANIIEKNLSYAEFFRSENHDHVHSA
jgi:trigger factor